MLLTIVLCLFVLRVFRWYVEQRHTPLMRAATVLAVVVAGVKIVLAHDVPAGVVSGAVAGAAAAGLVWVNRRFHSLASIPVWFALSLVLAFALTAAL